MFDMFKMMGRVGEIKGKMEEAKQRLKTIQLEEEELGGVVKVKLTAAREIINISLSEDFYNKYGNDEREAILTEAVNNALEKASARAKEEMDKEMKDVLPDIPGLDLNNMGGLLGF